MTDQTNWRRGLAAKEYVGLLTGTPLHMIQYSSQIQWEFIIIIIIINNNIIAAAAFGFCSSGMLGGIGC